MFEYARGGGNMSSGLDEHIELIQQEGVCEYFRAWAHQEYVMSEGIAWVEWTCWSPSWDEEGFDQEDNHNDDPNYRCSA